MQRNLTGNDGALFAGHPSTRRVGSLAGRRDGGPSTNDSPETKGRPLIPCGKRLPRKPSPAPRPSREGMVQAKAPEAFEVLCRHLNANDPRVAVAAATQILDRAYGRPVQQVDANIEENSSVCFYAEVPKPCSTTEEWLFGNPVAPQRNPEANDNGASH